MSTIGRCRRLDKSFKSVGVVADTLLAMSMAAITANFALHSVINRRESCSYIFMCGSTLGAHEGLASGLVHSSNCNPCPGEAKKVP